MAKQQRQRLTGKRQLGEAADATAALDAAAAAPTAAPPAAVEESLALHLELESQAAALEPSDSLEAAKIEGRAIEARAVLSAFEAAQTEAAAAAAATPLHGRRRQQVGLSEEGRLRSPLPLALDTCSIARSRAHPLLLVLSHRI